GAPGSANACTASPATCASLFPGATSFGSAADAADALVGRWQFCGKYHSGPADWAGEEFAADGKHYGLVADSSGNLVRDVSPADIDDWSLTLAASGGFELIIGNQDEGVAGLSVCPRVLTVPYEDDRLPL